MGQCWSALMSLLQPMADDNRSENPTTTGERAVRVEDVKFDVDFEGKDFHSHYKLGKELGSGAYSTVREGTHKKSGKVFAIKCMKRDNLPAEDEADLFEEVRILQKVVHPNVIDIFQMFKDDKSYYYVVMEYMKGGELFDRIVQKSFYNEQQARDLVKILLSAVKYIHDQNIVHRDLKPENLLMTSPQDDANIKLADFGFARSLDGGLMETQCGTPGYVAPEILRGVPYGTSVDMWSVGVIIYILLGGYPPFHDENQTTLFRKIKGANFKFHPEYWGTISNEAKDLIRRCLTVDVSKRLTAEEAVSHQWLLSRDVDLAKRNLDKNLEQLKLFNARRKLRAAIRSVILAQTLTLSGGKD